MAEDRIVALYDTPAHAELAASDLKAAGVPGTAISVHASGAAERSTTAAAPAREQGFWSSLLGGEPDHDTAVYERSVQDGSAVVTVKVSEGHVDRVMEILESHHPVDIDERAASYGLAGSTATRREASGTEAEAAAAPGIGLRGDEERLQLAEEQLQVGKRAMNRGTTRIRRFVVETPVEENVTLHSEHVTVERRPVAADVAVNDADFTERTIEATEMDEEAVIAKTARVREEVVVRKQVADRTETVRDTVRHEDVEITKDGAVETGTGRMSTGTVPPARP